jgi:4-aminobutyrate aminotransferase/(S)-3-amino-2-methylpropionate transaminase
VLEIIKREKVVEHSAKMGKVIRPRLEELKERYDIIGDVRGLGPMLAIEFVSDKKSKTPNADAASKVMKGSLASGLMVLKAGLYNNCIRLHPPLTIEDDILDLGLDILEKEVKKAA